MFAGQRAFVDAGRVAGERQAEASQQHRDILGENVLRGIDSETRHAPIQKPLQVGRRCRLDVGVTGVEIRQIEELAAANPARALGVDRRVVAAPVILRLDNALPVEVLVPVIPVLPLFDVKRCTGYPAANLVPHVIDHGIDIDTHAGVVATTHHVPKLCLRSGTADQVVAYRLVSRPPGIRMMQRRVPVIHVFVGR